MTLLIDIFQDPEMYMQRYRSMKSEVSLGVVSRPVPESEELVYRRWKTTAKVIQRAILCFLSDDL